MAKINRFEEIKAWQLAREIVRDIYAVSNQGLFGKDYALKEQIRRAAISVMSNIAEGFERYSTKEFAQFLNIARGSIAEVRSQLYTASDLHYLTESHFLALKDQCETISRHIANFIIYLRSSQKS